MVLTLIEHFTNLNYYSMLLIEDVHISLVPERQELLVSRSFIAQPDPKTGKRQVLVSHMVLKLDSN